MVEPTPMFVINVLQDVLNVITQLIVNTVMINTS